MKLYKTEIEERVKRIGVGESSHLIFFDAGRQRLPENLEFHGRCSDQAWDMDTTQIDSWRMLLSEEIKFLRDKIVSD